MKKGQDVLQDMSEQDFNRPPPDSDKLYMCIGERDIIEVAHPTPSNTIHAARFVCSAVQSVQYLLIVQFCTNMLSVSY